MSDSSKASTRKKILFFFSSFKKSQLAFLLVLTVFQGLVDVFTVGILVPFVALLSDPSSAMNQPYLKKFHMLIGQPELRAFIFYFGIFIILIAVMKALFSIFIKKVLFAFTYQAQNILANLLFGSYLSRGYSFFTSTDSSILLRNVNSITGSLVNGLLMPVLVLLSDSIVFIVLFFLLCYVNPLLTFLLGAALGIVLLGSHLFVRKRLSHMGAERTEVLGEIYQTLSESFQGIKDIKILQKENYFLDQFRTVSAKQTRIESGFALIAAIPALLNEFLGIGTVVCAVLVLLLRGDEIASIIPATSFYLLAGYRLIPAVSRISPSLHSIGFYSNAMDLIYRELSGIASTAIPRAAVIVEDRKIVFRNKIEFSEVEFSYLGNPYKVLRGVSLVIKKNTATALVGSSGAGKTTLVDILMGLYFPTFGRILIDEQPLNDDNIKRWRHSIGYIPQSIFLSDRSIEENIAFGVAPEKIDHAAVERAANLAQLGDVILQLPEGMKTRIGERGVKLSGGQRQRIGIARALYGDPELIIMDEATSAMDNLTEAEIVNQISHLGRTKTLLIIAHRLTTIRHCDQIYVMQNGEIESAGKYDELLKSSDLFARLASASKP